MVWLSVCMTQVLRHLSAIMFKNSKSNMYSIGNTLAVIWIVFEHFNNLCVVKRYNVSNQDKKVALSYLHFQIEKDFHAQR